MHLRDWVYFDANTKLESLLSSFFPPSLFLFRARLPLFAFEELPIEDVDSAESHVYALFYAVREAFDVLSCLPVAPFFEALDDYVLIDD